MILPGIRVAFALSTFLTEINTDFLIVFNGQPTLYDSYMRKSRLQLSMGPSTTSSSSILPLFDRYTVTPVVHCK
jgi:hypothetical protein